MNLSPQRETFGQDDQSWLGSAHGTSSADSVTLDLSTFSAAAHYPNGYLRSGTPIAKITASTKYGPYSGNASVTVTTNSTTALVATTGTFSVADVGDPISGAGIPVGATIASVTDATHATLSVAATASAAGVVVTIGSVDGRNVLAGFLLTPVRVLFYGSGAVVADAHGAILQHGQVVAANLPIAVDPAGVAAVAGRIIFN